MTKAGRETLSADTVRDLLDYNSETGVLTWKARPRAYFENNLAWSAWNARFSGNVAMFGRRPDGYLGGKILGKTYGAHRVAYLIYHGKWPIGEIDHINGVTGDNRIANLRDVSRAENSKNLKRPKSNSSSACGVSWDKRHSRWKAYINGDSKRMNLGSFKCFLAAGMVRRKAEADLGYHENHGRGSS